jgi:hypothetical protein
VTERQILDLVRDWLLSGDVKPHVYLELPGAAAPGGRVSS